MKQLARATGRADAIAAAADVVAADAATFISLFSYLFPFFLMASMPNLKK